MNDACENKGASLQRIMREVPARERRWRSLWEKRCDCMDVHWVQTRLSRELTGWVQSDEDEELVHIRGWTGRFSNDIFMSSWARETPGCVSPDISCPGVQRIFLESRWNQGVEILLLRLHGGLAGDKKNFAFRIFLRKW